MDLHVLAAELALGRAAVDDLRDRAYEILLAGYESPTMAVLAGAEKDTHPADLRVMFYKGLAEVGVPVPGLKEAAEILKRTWAREVVEGKAAAAEGASRIVGLLYDVAHLVESGGRYVGEDFGIARLAGLYWALDDTATNDPATRRDIEKEIVAACACIARGEVTNG
jgi:hypothetical protein